MEYSFDFKKAKDALEASPLKRAAIALRCGVSTQTITRIVNGHIRPGRYTALRLAQLVGLSEDDLWIPISSKKVG